MKNKRTPWKKLLEIAAMRKERREQWNHIHITAEIMNAAMPDVLFMTTGGNWHAPTIVAARNSVDKPREYLKLNSTKVGLVRGYALNVKNFPSKKGLSYMKYPGFYPDIASVIPTCIEVVNQMDKEDGYSPKVDKRKLINITRNKSNETVVTVMHRDSAGRFAKAEVARDYTAITFKDLASFKARNIRLYDYKVKSVRVGKVQLK